jgi:hypothetical protein
MAWNLHLCDQKKREQGSAGLGRSAEAGDVAMITKAFGLVLLVLGPSAAAYLAGYTDVSQYFALGAVLAINMTLLARPIAPFAALLPMLYAAAAVTADSTDGVAALIVAVAAAVGAASSQGLHRGLLSVLAAALIGSFEPASGVTVFERAGTMLAGCVYGVMLSTTLLRNVSVETRAVHPQTALSYALLLAVLVLIAWLAARLADFAHGWWLPLAAAAIGEPALDRPPGHAVARLAFALLVTLLLVMLIQAFDTPALRIITVAALLLLMFTVGRRTASLQALLFTPAAVLLVQHHDLENTVVEYLSAAFVASAIVFVSTLLGKWVLWTLRPDAGRLAA